MFAKFFRLIATALVLIATTSQVSAQVAIKCNLIQGGANGPYQECFPGGSWTPIGYSNGNYNLQAGIPAIFPSNVSVNVPVGYRRQECDPETYISNMARKTLGGAAIGAFAGLLAGDSRAAAGKGAAIGAFAGIASSLQCFILVKDDASRGNTGSKTSAKEFTTFNGNTCGLRNLAGDVAYDFFSQDTRLNPLGSPVTTGEQCLAARRRYGDTSLQ